MSDKQYKLGVIVYDGVNLFKNGEWTGIEFDSVEEGHQMIGFLDTLSNEQIDHWIRVRRYFTGPNKTFNSLKHNTKYSGQTTCYEHIASEDEEWKKMPFAGNAAIRAENVLEAQWSNLPVEVEADIKKLWHDLEFGNDFYYYRWINDKEDRATYPLIAEYLDSQAITRCLIHWWW